MVEGGFMGSVADIKLVACCLPNNNGWASENSAGERYEWLDEIKTWGC